MRIAARNLQQLLLGLVTLVLVVSCGASVPPTVGAPEQSSVTLTVSAAASLQEVLTAIAPDFQARYPHIHVDTNLAASGTLQRQIERGAPVDVFFPAATQPMEALAQAGLILPESTVPVVTNQLVLIAPQGSNLTIHRIAALKDMPIQHIAVGEFRSVPAGYYAQQLLTHLGILDSLQSKLVFGNSVRNVLSAVASGNAEVGFVYATDAARSTRVKILATAPPNSHAPIIYPVAVLNSSPAPQTAQTWIEFLRSDATQATFKAFGFGTVID